MFEQEWQKLQIFNCLLCTRIKSHITFLCLSISEDNEFFLISVIKKWQYLAVALPKLCKEPKFYWIFNDFTWNWKKAERDLFERGRAQSSYYSILIKYTPYVSRICDPTIDLQTWYNGTQVQNLSKKVKKLFMSSPLWGKYDIINQVSVKVEIWALMLSLSNCAEILHLGQC